MNTKVDMLDLIKRTKNQNLDENAVRTRLTLEAMIHQGDEGEMPWRSQAKGRANMNITTGCRVREDPEGMEERIPTREDHRQSTMTP